MNVDYHGTPPARRLPGAPVVYRYRLAWVALGLMGAIGLRAVPPGMAATGAAGSGPVEVSRVWETGEDFDACYRDRHIDSLSEPGRVKLVPRVLVADEMGAGGNNFQAVSGKTQARKILHIDDPQVTEALLMVDGSVSTCEIVVNGAVLDARPLARSYVNRNFEHYAVPPALLVAGTNTFVFRARATGGSGRIRVERGRPNRSAVSRDGGHSWDVERLCEGGYMQGELGVRLRLGRYAPTAWIASPVLDLAGTVMEDGIPCGREGRLEALDVDATVPSGTSVQAFVRTGHTPDGYEENWGPWQAWPDSRGTLQFARFLQWRLELTTSAPQSTPVVHRVVARASAMPVEAADRRVRVVTDANEQIVRSSYAFAYASHAGNSRVLRDRWTLGEVVAGGQTEFEKLKRLRQWVRDQWTNGWNTGALSYVPIWDARLILTLASGNLSLGMCTHYATVFVQCAQALGFPARSVFHGHALSEIWSNDHRKWVLMDAGGDTNDRRRATYHYEWDGIPMSLMEVHQAAADEGRWEQIRVRETNMSEGTDQVEPPYRATREAMEALRAGNNPHNLSQIFVELRNHFVDHREPEEPEHGMGHFKYLGHLFWKSPHTPDVSWTDFFTTREADLSWTLNQAQVHFLRAPGTPGALRVMLDTVTPDFAGYEFRFDEGEWIAWTRGPRAGPVSVEAYPRGAVGGCIAFDWALNPGMNTIEARPFNAAGVRGITSRLAVEMDEK